MPERAAAINRALLRLLAEARKEEGLSMEALAQRAGLDRTYVGRLEKEERQPTVVAAAALAAAMKLSLADLLLRAERMVEQEAVGDGTEIELVPAARTRLVDRSCFESDVGLREST